MLVFECEDVLEDVDLGHLPGQAALTIERPAPKLGMACFVQAARFADRRERLMYECWLWLDPFDPAENFCRAMASVLPFLVRHMALEMGIDHPFIMGSQ